MVDDQHRTEAARAYSHLKQACRLLERTSDHGIAAMVSHCMAMMQTRYPVGDDPLDEPS